MLALAVSASSFLWQVTTFRLSGSRIRIRLRPAFFMYNGTTVTFDHARRGWPASLRAEEIALFDQQVGIEMARITVANLGRTVVHVGDLGIDFGRVKPGRRKSSLVMSLPPLALNNGLANGDPIRLEPGQSANIYVAIRNTVGWAGQKVHRTSLLMRGSASVAGFRSIRSRRRLSWRVECSEAAFPHVKDGKPNQIFREIVSAWPTSDASGIAEAFLDIVGAFDNPAGSAAITEATGRHFPHIVSKVVLARKICSIGDPSSELRGTREDSKVQTLPRFESVTSS
jgi:hypothetical protein